MKKFKICTLLAMPEFETLKNIVRLFAHTDGLREHTTALPIMTRENTTQLF